ncbi:MAG: hypothetical protein RL621_1179 [Bacteroidota bacterium]|jgi:hypothetical protein
MKILLDPIFKSKDRVYHYKYGWGTVMEIHNGVNKRILIEFDDVKNLIREMKSESNLLSFTEYELKGFTQERPEELPNKGDIVWGRNEFPSEWHIGHFFEKRGDNYLISSHPQPTGWNNIVSEITTKNPYENESTTQI